MNEITIDIVVKIKTDKSEKFDKFESSQKYSRKNLEPDFIHEQIVGFARSLKGKVDLKYNPKLEAPQSTGDKIEIIDDKPQPRVNKTLVSEGPDNTHRGTIRNNSNAGPIYLRGKNQ